MSISEDILRKFGSLKLSEANGAETRLKVIDRVLFEVLGWTHDDVSVEPRVIEDGKSEYADYVIHTGFSAIVIEAKRVGTSLIEVSSRGRANLRGAIMKGEMGAAIMQARDYARFHLLQ